jgi:hypothetical protein
MQKNISPSSAQNLVELRRELKIPTATKIYFYFKANKVSVSCTIAGHSYGCSAATLQEALSRLPVHLKSFHLKIC